jgi:ABC-2 type transport system ATP-binding protein
MTVAVDHISLSVRRGEIFGLLGANGSGKSTLIRLISTLLIPDSGEIRVFGYDVQREERTVRRLINRVSVEASFFKKLSALENLMYAARLYDLPGSYARQRSITILRSLGLSEKTTLRTARAYVARDAAEGRYCAWVAHIASALVAR